MDIAANLNRLHARIAAACGRSGRSPSDVTLVAVTKNTDILAIRAAFAAGQRHFAENRVQEALDKIPWLPELRPGATWHMVGHVQGNKVRRVLQLFDVVQSVDSLALAEALNRLTPQPLPVFLEVNVAGEAAKTGMPVSQVDGAVHAIGRMSNLQLRGLMTVAPACDDPEDVRPVFKRLREMRDALGLQELSMGMTDDFEVAIEEGATLVRLGRAIFREFPAHP